MDFIKHLKWKPCSKDSSTTGDFISEIHGFKHGVVAKHPGGVKREWFSGGWPKGAWFPLISSMTSQLSLSGQFSSFFAARKNKGVKQIRWKLQFCGAKHYFSSHFCSHLLWPMICELLADLSLDSLAVNCHTKRELCVRSLSVPISQLVTRPAPQGFLVSSLGQKALQEAEPLLGPHHEMVRRGHHQVMVANWDSFNGWDYQLIMLLDNGQVIDDCWRLRVVSYGSWCFVVFVNGGMFDS